MAQIELLVSSAHPDVLPRQCVISGQTQRVEFRKMSIPSPQGALFTLVLPVADLPYRRWRATGILNRIAIYICFVQFVVGLIISFINLPIGLLLYLAGILLPMGAHFLIASGYGPVVQRAGRKGYVIKIPNEAAAEILQRAIDRHEILLATARKAPSLGKTEEDA